MLYGYKLSAVVPCKNEANSIINTVNAIPAYVDEIIVVENGSIDKTVENARTTRAKVLSVPNLGPGVKYGYAILLGLKEATGDYIFTLDGDGSHPADKISEMLGYMLKNKVDVICGARLPASDTVAISSLRKLGIYILNIETFLLYGIVVKDMLSGMFGFKRSAIKQLNLKMGDWNLSPEIKISAAINKNLKFAEFPIVQIPRTAGVSKQIVWNTGTGHFLYILKKRFVEDNPLLKELHNLKLRFKLVRS